MSTAGDLKRDFWIDAQRQRLLPAFKAVRAVWPESLPPTARLGVSDFTPGSYSLE